MAKTVEYSNKTKTLHSTIVKRLICHAATECTYGAKRQL